MFDDKCNVANSKSMYLSNVSLNRWHYIKHSEMHFQIEIS